MVVDCYSVLTISCQTKSCFSSIMPSRGSAAVFQLAESRVSDQNLPAPGLIQKQTMCRY